MLLGWDDRPLPPLIGEGQAAVVPWLATGFSTLASRAHILGFP